MRRLVLFIAASLPLLATLVPTAAGASPPAKAGGGTAPVCRPMQVHPPTGTRVVSVTATAHAGGTVSFPAPPLPPAPPPVSDVPPWCDVTVTVTHPGAGDHVTVKVSLPQNRAAWNGRFQATGGSAYLAGDVSDPAAALVSAVKSGYAAAATDAGVGQSPGDVSAWALTPGGRVNTPLLKDFASRSMHDMAVIGKAVTATFYGTAARYAYWNGCSTGGRQGYMEAQEHPTDFQGILADAPAVNWDRFAVATLWPQVVFNEEKTYPTQCELDAFNTAAVTACDTLDGVADGIIDNPQDCAWDPGQLIGTTVICDGQPLTITPAVADVVRKIWAGPVSPTGRALWYGPNKGASFSYLASAGTPFVVADQWVKFFVEHHPLFDTKTVTYEQFAQIFRESQRSYNEIIGTDDPDLSGFAASGGKLLTWQGQADQLVPTQGTVDYRERVEQAMGGTKRVDQFYRLFLLPGVEHCGGGSGLQAADPLGALVNWVEKGQAPRTLAVSGPDANGKTAHRDICSYPQQTRFAGHGDVAAASSYRCVPAH